MVGFEHSSIKRARRVGDTLRMSEKIVVQMNASVFRARNSPMAVKHLRHHKTLRQADEGEALLLCHATHALVVVKVVAIKCHRWDDVISEIQCHALQKSCVFCGQGSRTPC